MGAFKIQPDGSALYDEGNNTFIYTPPDAVDPATGKKVAGDQSLVKLVDGQGNVIPGKTNADALKDEQKFEGAGSNYGTHAPGGGTFPNPVTAVKDAVSGLYNYARGAAGLGDVAGPPGVGGGAADVTKLVQDPTTGYYYDPTSGTTYTDSSGRTPVTNPNIAQQVAADFATHASLLQKLGGNQATIDTAVAGQQKLGGRLLDTISNPNASSVAQTQLGIGADAIARQQLQQAAGTTGANAFLAHRNAANNIGNLQATLNGQQALVRANEVDAATGRLAGVLGSQATEGQAGYNANLSGAVQEGSQAMGGQQTQQGMATAAAQQTQQNKQKMVQGTLSAISGAGTLPGASGDGSGSGTTASGWTPSAGPGSYGGGLSATLTPPTDDDQKKQQQTGTL